MGQLLPFREEQFCLLEVKIISTHIRESDIHQNMRLIKSSQVWKKWFCLKIGDNFPICPLALGDLSKYQLFGSQNKLHCNAISAQRVGFFNIGSGRVLEKIPGIGLGSGRVGVLKIRSGIFGYLFYSRVIPGIPGIFG